MNPRIDQVTVASARATALMRSAGIDATDVTGGTDAWIEAGRPVETATRPQHGREESR